MVKMNTDPNVLRYVFLVSLLPFLFHFSNLVTTFFLEGVSEIRD